MAKELENLKAAVLATDGVEQIELTRPVEALRAAGATVHVVAPKSGSIQGWNHFDKADTIDVDRDLNGADPDQYDALVLPGGVINPDQLRLVPEAIDFVRAFVSSGKPIAAICHGPWLLVESGLAKGRKVTSWPSVKTDLVNAGAQWEDAEVVVDGNLITSRKPDDIPAFNAAIVKAVAA